MACVVLVKLAACLHRVIRYACCDLILVLFGKHIQNNVLLTLAHLPPAIYILNVALPESELFNEDVHYYLCTLLLNRVDPTS